MQFRKAVPASAALARCGVRGSAGVLVLLIFFFIEPQETLSARIRGGRRETTDIGGRLRT